MMKQPRVSLAERQLIELVRAAPPFCQPFEAIDQVSPAQWANIVRAAQQHGLASVLHNALCATGNFEKLDSDSRQPLERARWQTTAANWNAYCELERLLRLFAPAQIPVVLLKGSALALTLYPDMSLRPFSDIDLLIRDSDLLRVRGLLLENGYEPLDEMAAGTSLDFAGEQTFSRKMRPPVDVDLHRHVAVSAAYRRRVPIEWFWERTEAITVNGQRAWQLRPDAQWLQLSLHYALNHHQARLIWSYDLALLLNSWGQRMDWQALAATARQFGTLPPLQYALKHVTAFWGVSLPADAQSAWAKGQGSPRARLIFALARAREPHARAFWDGFSMPGAKAKAKFFGRHLFPTRAYMRSRYLIRDERAIPLYYVWRVVAGMYQVVRSAVSSMTN